MIEQNALVKLTHGSVLNWQDFKGLDREIKELEAERDRARALAAKLEEVVAMRTAVLAALVEERARPVYITARMEAIMDWAVAQLSEVP